MPSIIEGYNYDIFISYRQNDNKYDGWVTEFVDNLNKELEANIKDKISVYFDINPQDGLLETDSVDKSLENKLKCLIFIPIISRTYCDSKSFAWQYEFCAFNKLAKEDKVGRDIKLTSGNVASRILPIKIHNLDPEDKELLENELKGVLRGIEFIYKEPGVNRPLRANEDHPDNNLNKTYYRNQINKAANAVKEIITALKKQSLNLEKAFKQDLEINSASGRNMRTKFIVGSLLLFAALLVGYFIIPKLFNPKEQVEKSIAVLPFANLGSDEDKAWFNDGITDIIINKLSKISDLRVLGWTSTQKYKEEKKSITDIGKELGVNYIIEGTVQRQGDKMRISVQLIRVLNEGHIWSDIFDRDWKDIFEVQTEIAQRIAEELKNVLTPEDKVQISTSETKNPEAYSSYLKGRFFWNNRSEEGQKKSVEYFEKSVAEDPDYALAYAGLADAYYIIGWYGWLPRSEAYTKAKKYALRALSIDMNLAEAHNTLGAILSWSEWKWEEARKEFLLAIKLNPNYASAHQYYSEFLDVIRQNKEARVEINLALELDPSSKLFLQLSAYLYYHEGRLNESLDDCRKMLEIDNEYRPAYWRYFYDYVRQGENLKAVEALQKIMLLDTLNIKYANVVKEVYSNSGINGIFSWLIEWQLKKAPFTDFAETSLTIASWYAKLEKKDKALDWIEKSLKEPPPSLPRINNNPDFDNLRSEPRFQVLIKKMGLSEYQKPN